MTQIRQDHSFKPELASVFIRRKEVLFKCNIDAQVLIYSAIYRPHATLSQDLDDTITFV